MSKPVLILFGTQSGNSEDLASQLAKSATAHGLTPTVLDMDATNLEMMASSERILIICSTWGEGEMPDSAEALWDSINAEGVPKMENTHFSVCALGDTSYEFYCQSGKDWDRRLEELGAKRVFARQDCDVDFDEPYAAWAAGALPAISSVGYIGGKRYIRAVANFSGTHGTATPLGVSVIKGHARKNPVS